MANATKSFSLSIEVLQKLESDAYEKGIGLSQMLENILRERYDMVKEE